VLQHVRVAARGRRLRERAHKAVEVTPFQIPPRQATRVGHETPKLSIRLGRVRQQQQLVRGVKTHHVANGPPRDE